MSLQPLPPKVQNVCIPHYFSPSRVAELERCALSVLVDPDVYDVLPQSPLAALGTVLHHAVGEVCAGRWGTQESPRAAFDGVVAESTERMESHLVERGWGGLVPLRKSVGIARWQRRRARAWRWIQAEEPSGAQVAWRPLQLIHAPSQSDDTQDMVTSGPEALVVWRAGRLRGRADRITVRPDGTRRVLEYKTGALRDRDGELLHDIGLQASLYALAVQTVLNTKVDVEVVGGETIKLPWNTTERRRVQERLDAVHARLPAGEDIHASALAAPGEHCRRCRIRPACAVYLRTAPTLWTEPGVGAGMPLDVWGQLEGRTVTGPVTRLELADDAGLRVVVDGLDPSRDMTELELGTRVYLFGLERAEAHMHGERVRPTNLREHRPGTLNPGRPAPGVRVFIES